MRTINNIFTGLFLLIAAGSALAVLYGATHQIYVCGLCLILAFAFNSDNHQTRKS